MVHKEGTNACGLLYSDTAYFVEKCEKMLFLDMYGRDSGCNACLDVRGRVFLCGAGREVWLVKEAVVCAERRGRCLRVSVCRERGKNKTTNRFCGGGGGGVPSAASRSNMSPTTRLGWYTPPVGVLLIVPTVADFFLGEGKIFSEAQTPFLPDDIHQPSTRPPLCCPHPTA